MAKILLVEDDPTIRSAYTLALEAAGHQVLVAPDGLEGLRILTQYQPELILLDMWMPHLNGLEFLRAHRRQRGSAQVVILSNVAGPDDIAEATSLGAVKYLIKAHLNIQGLLAEVSALSSGQGLADAVNY